MALKIKLQKFGSSLWFSVSQDVADDLGVSEGDEFYLVRTPDGLLLTAPDSEYFEALGASEDVMRRYPNAMQKLAK